jgi:hypothetical protein
MLKWIILILAVLVAAYLLFSAEFGRTYRRVSLINGISALKTAQANYAEHGYITNRPTASLRASLFTNAVSIGGTQYYCFLKVIGGYDWEGGALVMTTNETLIWLDAHRLPKIITRGHRPPMFGGPY